jgi:hypothetical protein
MMLTHIASTLREYSECIEKTQKDWETKKDGVPDLWYRGLRKSSWPLVPKLYRPQSTARELLETEDEIREEFVRRAPSLTAQKPGNAWEWYFLMQHYGGSHSPPGLDGSTHLSASILLLRTTKACTMRRFGFSIRGA